MKELAQVPPVGPAGATGAGVPTAGTTHQVLRKIDNTNNNTEWHTLGTAAESATTAFVSSTLHTSVTGSLADGTTVLKNLLTALAAAGIIVDNTTA